MASSERPILEYELNPDTPTSKVKVEDDQPTDADLIPPTDETLEQKAKCDPLVSTIKKEEDEYVLATDSSIIASSEQKQEVKQDPLAATVKEEPIDDPLTDFEMIVPEGQISKNETDFDPLQGTREELEHGEVGDCSKISCGDAQSFVFVDCGGNSSSETHLRKHEPTTLFRCDLCKECFSKRQDLVTHKHKHSGKKGFKCETCGNIFIHRRNLTTHSRKFHSKGKPFICDLCEKSFVRKSDLLTHRYIHTGVKNFKCEICGIVFTRSGGLKKHSRIYHSEDKPFICDLCKKCFSKRQNLVKHRCIHSGVEGSKSETRRKISTKRAHLTTNSRKVHSEGKYYICDVCNQCFAKKIDLKTHLYIHSGAKGFKCQTCGRIFTYIKRLATHRRQVHKDDNPYICNECNQCFAKQIDLKTHLYIHSKAKGFKCQTCGRVFTQRKNLTAHRRQVHKDDNPYSCDLCEKCFPKQSDLARHRHIHCEIKSFKCETCGKMFTAKSTLALHRRKVHSEDTPYSCDICKKGFVKSFELASHRYIHSGMRGFRCETCGTSFTSKIYLTKHISLIHSNEKSYKCEICGENYTQLLHLEAHKCTEHYEVAGPTDSQFPGCSDIAQVHGLSKMFRKDCASIQQTVDQEQD